MNNDDRFENLEALDSWQLVNENQDIRGRAVVSATGESYGRIADMMVDKDKEHVAAVRMNDGRIVPAEKLEIRDRDVVYHDDRGASRVDYTRVRRPIA